MKQNKFNINELKKSSLQEHKEMLRAQGLDPEAVEIVQEVFYDQGFPVVATHSPPPKKKSAVHKSTK